MGNAICQALRITSCCNTPKTYLLYWAGCGLPPGPSGLIGAAEGVSYLTLLGIAGWGIGMRATTSKGLPAGELQGSSSRSLARSAALRAPLTACEGDGVAQLDIGYMGLPQLAAFSAVSLLHAELYKY